MTYITLVSGAIVQFPDSRFDVCNHCFEVTEIYPINGILLDVAVNYFCRTCLLTKLANYEKVPNCINCLVPTIVPKFAPIDAVAKDRKAYCPTCYALLEIEDEIISSTPSSERTKTKKAIRSLGLKIKR